MKLPIFPRVGLLFLLCALPAAAGEVEDLEAELNAGDWNARMHAVHSLAYLGDSGERALELAAQDGDWQVRMAAAHALGPLGSLSRSFLKSVAKRDPCRVVRLIALHNLGSAEPIVLETSAFLDAYTASTEELNDCSSQPGPGRLAQYAGEGMGARNAGVSPAAVQPPSKEDRYAAVKAWASQEAMAVERSRMRGGGWPFETTRKGVSPELDAPVSGTPQSLSGGPGIQHEEDAISADFAPAPPPRRAVFPALADPLAGGPEALPIPQGVSREGPVRGAEGAAGAPPSRKEGPPELLARRGPSGETLSPSFPPTRQDKGISAPLVLMPTSRMKVIHEVLGGLIATLKNGENEERARAADELGKMGLAAAAAVDSLMAVMNDKSPQVRASAVLALGNIGAPSNGAVSAMVKALNDGNVDVRFSAALALSRMPGESARRAFHRYVNDELRANIERAGP